MPPSSWSSRGWGEPIERPKSVTTEWFKAQAAKVIEPTKQRVNEPTKGGAIAPPFFCAAEFREERLGYNPPDWTGPMDRLPNEIGETLRDLAEGRVQRSRHGLVMFGEDQSALFARVLRTAGYGALRVREIPVASGVRFPAWVIRAGTAHFGHVFLEKFSENERRVLFGSVVRDWRGDWEVILTRASREIVWVNLDRGSPFDEDRPSGGLG